MKNLNKTTSLEELDLQRKIQRGLKEILWHHFSPRAKTGLHANAKTETFLCVMAPKITEIFKAFIKEEIDRAVAEAVREVVESVPTQDKLLEEYKQAFGEDFKLWSELGWWLEKWANWKQLTLKKHE